jgi:citrate lyase beta subunit
MRLSFFMPDLPSSHTLLLTGMLSIPHATFGSSSSEPFPLLCPTRLSAIDMVCIQYKDENQLIKECQQGYNLGFDGKQAIHPNQVAVIYKHFTPPPEQIEMAKKIVLANRKNQNEGVGAWELDGKMIDMPMVRHFAQLKNKKIQ